MRRAPRLGVERRVDLLRLDELAGADAVAVEMLRRRASKLRSLPEIFRHAQELLGVDMPISMQLLELLHLRRRHGFVARVVVQCDH